MSIRYKHQSLSVADADRSAAFYERHFGYRQVKRQAHDDGVRIVLERADHRLQVFSGGETRDLDWRQHMAFVATNFDELAIALAAEAPLLRPPHRLRPDGARLLFAADPDGYPIEVIEATEA